MNLFGLGSGIAALVIGLGTLSPLEMCIRDRVVLYEKEDMAAEETLRRRFLSKAVHCGIQLVQLPCPESVSYTHLDVYKRQLSNSTIASSSK